MSGLPARLLSAAVGIPLLFVAMWYGGIVLYAVVLVAVILGLAEFYRLSKGLDARPDALTGSFLALFLVSAVAAAATNFSPPARSAAWILHFSSVRLFVVFGFGVLACVLWSLWTRRRVPLRDALKDWSLTTAGVLYVSLLSYAILIRFFGKTGNPVEGREWLLFAVFTTFATDTGAYFIGRFFGRRPLAPSISPKKTQEGAAAGFLAAVGAALALGAVLGLPAPAWQQALIGAAVGVISQLGDLAESKFKRLAKAKDASHLIPGHGGILDRTDSLVFAMPVVYYLVSFWLGR